MLPEGPTFLISLGAQKTGTSFLADFLRNHPRCSIPPTKEVHFFDRLGSMSQAAQVLRDDLAGFEKDRKKAGFFNRAKRKVIQEKIDFVSRQLALVESGKVDVKAYEDLLRSIAKPGDQLFADMTPANGLLSSDLLAKLATLESQPKFILILRDPIDRLWSAMRMMASRAAIESGGDISQAANEIIREFLAGERQKMADRSDYAGMLHRAKSALPSERLHIALFDTFLTTDGVADFCKFAAIDSHPVNFSIPSHVGQKVHFDEDMKEQLKIHLRPQYEAVAAHFGDLPETWLKNAS